MGLQVGTETLSLRKAFEKQSTDKNRKDTVKHFQTKATRHPVQRHAGPPSPSHGEEPWAGFTALRAPSSPTKCHRVTSIFDKCLSQGRSQNRTTASLQKSLTLCPSTQKAGCPRSLPPTSGLQETGCRHPARRGERSPRPPLWGPAWVVPV